MFVLISILLLTGLASTSTIPAANPLPPSHDPWYTAPSNFESASPGQVLKVRVAPGNLTTFYGNASDAYNVLFRTTNSHYEPTWAVTTVFLPSSKTQCTSLLSYQIPYNSPDINASPSYALYNPGYYQTIIGPDISDSLGRGWAVNVPDHEGHRASFACAVQEGHTTLDSLRAVLSLHHRLDFAKKPRIALWGYSGGSVASEFAMELQVQYAPDLEIAGAALGGVVPTFSKLVPHVTKSPFAGLVPALLIGLTSQYPAARAYLDSHLKQSGPYNATAFYSVKKMNVEQAFATFANQSMYNYFRNGAAFFQAAPILYALYHDTAMSYHGVPQPPLFIYKAINDELSPVTDTDHLVSRYCGLGANIYYQRNTIGGHLAEETNGDASAMQWLAQVLEGEYHHTGCTVRNVTISIDTSPE